MTYRGHRRHPGGQCLRLPHGPRVDLPRRPVQQSAWCWLGIAAELGPVARARACPSASGHLRSGAARVRRMVGPARLAAGHARPRGGTKVAGPKEARSMSPVAVEQAKDVASGSCGRRPVVGDPGAFASRPPDWPFQLGHGIPAALSRRGWKFREGGDVPRFAHGTTLAPGPSGRRAARRWVPRPGAREPERPRARDWLGGTAIGASEGQAVGMSVQRPYDLMYMRCAAGGR